MDENKRNIVLDKARDAIISGNPLELYSLIKDHPDIFKQQRSEIELGESVFDPLLLAAYHGEESCGLVLLQFGFNSSREYDGTSSQLLAERHNCHRLLQGIRLQQQGGDGDELKRLAALALNEQRELKRNSLHEQAKQAIYNNALCDKQGNTLLHVCAMRDDLAALVTVHTLAVMGIFVNSQNKAGETALHIAANRGSTEMCRALLLSGANPSLRDRLGQSAAECSDSEDVRSLIGQFSPGLAESLLAGKFAGVSRALQLWVSPHSQLLLGHSAIDFCAEAAATGRQSSAIAELVERESPFLDLLHNVLADNTEGAKSLLRRLPDLKLDRQHPDTGLTLVAAAVRNNNAQLVRALTAAGATLRNVRVSGQPLLHFAIASNCSFELLLLLLEAGADASARDADGFTILHQLIRSNLPASHFRHVLLANNGNNVLLLADRLPISCECRSPRDMADRLGRKDLVEAIDQVVNELFLEGSRVAKGRLMQLAVKFYGQDNFRRAAAVSAAANDRVKLQFVQKVPAIEKACEDLFDAIRRNDMKRMKELNEADYQDVCGYTALIRAVAAERYDMAVWILAERPQQALLADNEGLTPLHYAYLLADTNCSIKFVQLLTKSAPVPLPEAEMEAAADMRGFVPCSLRERKQHAFFQQVLHRATVLSVYGDE